MFQQSFIIDKILKSPQAKILSIKHSLGCNCAFIYRRYVLRLLMQTLGIEMANSCMTK